MVRPVRNPCFDENGQKEGARTPEEDWKLIAYVTRYGHWTWHLLPKFAGLARSGRSCRLRWLNYLRPNIKRGNYTQEEETVIKLVQHLGKRWSAIAAQLPGKTDNEIKNYWYTNLKKRFQRNLVTHEKAQVSKSRDHSPADPLPNNIIGPLESFSSTSQSTDSCPSATLPSSCEISITADHTTAASNKSLVPEDEFAFLDASEESGSFLLDHSPVEPMPNNIIHPFQSLPITSQSTESYPFSISSLLNEFSVTTYHTASAANENLVSEDEYAFMDSYKEPMIESFWLDHSELNQCQTM